MNLPVRVFCPTNSKYLELKHIIENDGQWSIGKRYSLPCVPTDSAILEMEEKCRAYVDDIIEFERYHGGQEHGEESVIECKVFDIVDEYSRNTGVSSLLLGYRSLFNWKTE